MLNTLVKTYYPNDNCEFGVYRRTKHTFWFIIRVHIFIEGVLSKLQLDLHL